MVAVDLPRPEVPAAVAVVRDFVNTTDHETGADDIADLSGLGSYLSAEGLCVEDATATEADLLLAHELRAGLRRALELNHVGRRADIPELGEALRRLAIGLDWSQGGASLRVTAEGVRGALARIGLAAHSCTVADTWWRLKICASDACEWAYFDHSKNRSRHWCEYGCGNKIKTRAYRDRRRAALDTPEGARPL